MTNQQLASLFNIGAVSLVLLISLLVLRKYRRNFFGYWTASYFSGLLSMGCETLVSFSGRNLALTTVESMALVFNIWCLVQTALRLQGRTLSRKYLYIGFPICTLGMIALAARDVPFMAAAALPFIGLSGCFIWLGIVVLRGVTSGARWLGWPLMATGVLPFVFPFIGHTHFALLGYVAGGLLNSLTGIGMVVMLLESTAVELRLKNEELLKLDRMKSNFISTVSHELRTPLTAIKGATWILEQGLEGPLTDGQTNLVGMLSSQSDRLARLITDVLDFSKLETGMMTYDLKEGDLLAVVQSAVTDYAHVCESKGIEVAVDLNSQGTVRFDGDRMIQVILNLVSNAAKFTPSGGKVTVSSHLKDGSMLLSVADTGIGIAPEFHEHIFAKFYQVEDHLRRTADGTGLGLSICKSIIEDGHGGRIWVESTPGEGSTFWIALPLVMSGSKAPSEAARV